MNDPFTLFPESASTFAPQVDALTFLLLGLCGTILIGITAFILLFCIKYRGQVGKHIPLKSASTHFGLEIGWMTLPALIFIVIFCMGAKVFFTMHQVPPDAMEIYVTGKQWMWKFQHSDGTRELNALHLPLGQPIKLIMGSEDVIHSLYIPAFRIKQDLVPGRFTSIWFEATKVGQFHLFCAEFCGNWHSRMRAEVTVLKPEDFQIWKSTHLTLSESEAPINLITAGRSLFQKHACIQCHETGAGVLAPSLNGIYLKKILLSNDREVIADENYIRESIVNPGAKIVKGFSNTMPSFDGQLSEDELFQLIGYIKSLTPPKEKTQ